MRRSWAAATVGALVLVVGALSYFLVKVTNERAPSGEGILVWGRFRDAAGLFQKSRVQTAGIPVGQIEKRELDPDMPMARITVRLLPGVKVWENAVVSKKSASLLGEFYLEIDPGTPIGIVKGEKLPMRQLKNGDQILNIREPTGMADLMADVGTIMPIMRDILQDVRTLTSGPIASAAENVNKMIETNSIVLQSVLTKVDHIAGDIEQITDTEGGNIRIAIQNVRDITESIKSLVGTSEGQVSKTGEAVRGSLQKLQATVDNLDKSLKNVETITTRLEKGEGTAGRLLTDDTIARNVEDITEDAGGFIRGITKLQTIVGLRTEYNFLSGQPKVYLSVQLVPRPDKFYLIEIVDDPRGLRESVVTNTESARGNTISKSTTYSLNRFKYTLQFGKTFFGLVTTRFGIKESTGGVGLDFHLFRERLLLSVDLFDTQFNRYPRVQGRVAIAPFNQRFFYLSGGVDDIINKRANFGSSGGFDWFLGGQLVFNDEDLKSLLLFGGGAAGGAKK
ncbi:MAG: MCE family protein [Deltaproteobacteria bacterium]|nr:MCE family protein [Deltaproteobacteria bacterium]